MQRKTRAATGAETPHAAIAAYDGLGAWSRWAAASLPTVKNQPASSEAVHAGVHLAIGGHARAASRRPVNVCWSRRTVGAAAAGGRPAQLRLGCDWKKRAAGRVWSATCSVCLT